MVQELRQIILSNEELISALDAHNRVTPNFLPVGKIASYDVVDRDNIQITFQVTPCAQEVSMRLDSSTLLQPLIRFCLENNIPLPRQGKKFVTIEGDRVSLRIVLDSDHLIESLVFDKQPVYAEVISRRI